MLSGCDTAMLQKQMWLTCMHDRHTQAEALQGPQGIHISKNPFCPIDPTTY